MKTRITLTMMLMLAVLAGCESFDEQIGDPNSGLNTAVGVIEWVGPAATATGTPWGLLAGLVVTVTLNVVQAFKNHKKDLIIGEQDEDFKNVETVTAFMVDVVEGLPDEAKAKFKEMIGSKLKENDFYRIGKAIISGLKG